MRRRSSRQLKVWRASLATGCRLLVSLVMLCGLSLEVAAGIPGEVDRASAVARSLEAPTACEAARLRVTRRYMSRRLGAASRAQRRGKSDASEQVLSRRLTRFAFEWQRVARRCPDDGPNAPTAEAVAALIESVAEILLVATDPRAPGALQTQALCEGPEVTILDGQCVLRESKAEAAVSRVAGQRSLSRSDATSSSVESSPAGRKARRCAAIQLSTLNRFSNCRFRALARVRRGAEALAAANDRCQQRFERRWQARHTRVCGEPGLRPGPEAGAVEALLVSTVDQLATSLDDDAAAPLTTTQVCRGPDVVVSDSGVCQVSPDVRSERTLAGLSAAASSFEYIGDLRYRLTLDAVEARVALYSGRPLSEVVQQDFAGWLEAWEARGDAGRDAVMVMSDPENGGAERVVLLELLSATAGTAGSFQFDVTVEENLGTPLLDAGFGRTRLFVDNQVGLPEAGDETGLIVIAADEGELRQSETGDSLVLSLQGLSSSASAVSQSPTKGIRDHAFLDLVAAWDTLHGNTGVSRAALVFRSEATGGPTQFMLVELGSPTLGTNGDLSVPVTPVSGSLTTVVGLNLTQPNLVLGQAATKLPPGCVDDSQCEGSRWCDPELGACFYSACTQTQDCRGQELCVAPGESSIVSPPAEGGPGLCIDVEACSADPSCSDLALCDGSGHCKPKACQNWSQCGVTSPALCVGGVCQAVETQGDVSPTRNRVSVGCASTPKSSEEIATDAKAFCQQMKDPSGKAKDSDFEKYVRPMCESILKAMIMRTENLAGFLHNDPSVPASSRADYCYKIESGKDVGFGFVQSQSCDQKVADRCDFSCPTDSVKEALTQAFEISTTTLPNYENRFAVLETSSSVANYSPFSDAAGYADIPILWEEQLVQDSLGEQSRGQVDWWQNWWQTALEDHEDQQKKYLHAYSTGDPGGGCEVQGYGDFTALDGQSPAPGQGAGSVIRGGNFKFSVGPKGLVTVGEEHGMHLCASKAPAIAGARSDFASCSGLASEETSTFGHNVQYCRNLSEGSGPPYKTPLKDILLGERSTFQNYFNEGVAKSLRQAHSVTMTCGGGANPLFSSKPTAPAGMPFKVRYSYGTGGAVLSTITRMDAAKARHLPLLKTTPTAASAPGVISGTCPCEMAGNCGIFCKDSPYPHPTPTVVEPAEAFASRGVLTAEGDAKIAVPALVSGAAAAYEPYHFAIDDPAAVGELDTLENLYIPGSNSLPRIFVEKWADKNGYKATESDRLQSNGLKAAYYTLNLNPHHFDYKDSPSNENYRKDFPRQWGPVAREVPPWPQYRRD